MTEILTLFFATYAGIRTSVRSTTPYGIASTLDGTLPYHDRLLRATVRSFGIRLEPRYIFGATPLDQSGVTRCLKDGSF